VTWYAKVIYPLMTRLTRDQVVNQSFLEMRSYLLEIAATLDRYDRAETRNGEQEDVRWTKIRQALDILAKKREQPDRTEALLMLFSDLTPLEK
jgi:hypothetical protein